VIIFFAGVIVTVFTSIEDGIYVTIGLSGGLMLFRIAKAHGHFLGRVPVHHYVGDEEIVDPDESRNLYLPVDHADGSNPIVPVSQPFPGVFVFRFSEGLIYPNANHYTDGMLSFVFANCRRTSLTSYPRKGDRPWNDPGPRTEKELRKEVLDNKRPVLRAIILDFVAVNNIDVTCVQNLIDVRNQLDRFTAPERVEWHFANIRNPWTKRALAAGGFGQPFGEPKYVFSVVSVGISRQAFPQDVDSNKLRELSVPDLQEHTDPITEIEKGSTRVDLAGGSQAFVSSVDRPWFHTDLDEALFAVSRTLSAQPDPSPSSSVEL